MTSPEPPIRFSKPSAPLGDEVEERLRSALTSCPDVAFAHLVDVQVEGIQEQPSLSLFVWLQPEAVRSLRASLNLVSETVARSIPRDRFVDVLVLNSVPEMLDEIERVGCLFVEPDPGERSRALAAGGEPPGHR